MQYRTLLKKYIDRSGLSLREISRRCKARNTPVSQAYISKLLNGDTTLIPSEEISRALAEITGGDPDKLVMTAYIEKAPESVRDALYKIDNIDSIIDEFLRVLVSTTSDDEWKQVVEIPEHIEANKFIDIIKDTSKLSIDSRIEIFRVIISAMERGELKIKLKNEIKDINPIQKDNNQKKLDEKILNEFKKLSQEDQEYVAGLIKRIQKD